MIKKIMITLMMTLLLFITSSMVYADVTTEVESESTSLIDKGIVSFSNVTFNMSNYMSVGYVTLNMGQSTTYDINLSTVLQYFDHFTLSNVSSIYLTFDLQAVYTGYTASEYQWLSSNPSFDSQTKRLNLGTTMPTSTSVEIWWNVIGQSGGAPSMTSGGLRIGSITLTVEYSEAIDLYTPISNWNDLPLGNNLMSTYETYQGLYAGESMYTAEVVSNVNGLHDIFLDLEDEGRYVAQNINLPSEIENETFDLVMYFATADYKYLWFFTNLRGDAFNSDFLLWNLTTGQFEQIVTGTIYGMPYVTGNGITTYNMAYVDYAIPWEIDEIVSIRMSYEYRYHYLTGSYGQYYEEQKTLYRDAYTNVNVPWWSKMLTILANGAELVGDTTGWLDYNQIQDVTTTYTLSKKQTFVSYLNANTDFDYVEYTVQDVFPEGTTVAKVFLGQYDKFGSNGVEIKDVVIMNIRYMINGVEYSQPFPDQEIPDMPPVYPGDPTIPEDPWQAFLREFWKLVSQVYLIFLGVLAYGLMRLFSFVLPKKNRKNILFRIGMTAVFFLIFYLGYTP